jgi:homoserine kinase type II
VTAQHALIRHLRGAGFPAPQVYATQRGSGYVELRGRLYEVYEFVPGDLVDATHPAHVAAAASTLGRYHGTVAGYDHAALHWARERYGVEALTRIVGRRTTEWRGKLDARAHDLCQRLRTHLQDLQARRDQLAKLPALVIHGDYHADNLIVRGDKIAGLVDYDQAHWSWRALEVAEALIFFARESEPRLVHIVYKGALDLGAVESFLVAYGTAIRLSDAEIRALPDLVRIIWICAALDPPLGPPVDIGNAPQALSEVLYLADWAQAHAEEITEIGLASRRSG